MKREIIVKTAVFLMGVLTRYKLEGVENIPVTGPVIIATNHLSRFDIPLLGCIPTRPDITAIVTDKYQEYPFFKWVTTWFGGIWIDRTKADFTAFRIAAEVLSRGTALGIAPEGTRSEGQLLEGKPGTTLLAIKTGVPVVPVGISGTDKAAYEMKRLRRPEIYARFGKPLVFPPLDRENRDANIKKYTDEIMCQIAAKLPARYHGFYASHPRLQEIIAEQGPVL